MEEERIASFLRSLQKETDPELTLFRREAERAGVPIVRPETEGLLRFFAELTDPRRILEIGTAVGYSGTVLLKAAPKARLTTVENDEERVKLAEERFRAFGLRDRVTVVGREAGAVLAELEGEFELIFLDAAKAQYVLWLPELLKHLAPGGVLLADNVFREGDVLESRYAIRHRDRTIHDRMRAFLRETAEHPALESIVLPMGDGVSVSFKKRPSEEGSE